MDSKSGGREMASQEGKIVGVGTFGENSMHGSTVDEVAGVDRCYVCISVYVLIADHSDRAV
jgi:hypothetical protein